MSSEMEIVEKRLTSFVSQLWTEFGIFERLVYKHKNQHKRSSYFKYILKVRSDLKLLKLANVYEIFDSCFIAINGNNPRQKLRVLESLKRKRCGRYKYNFLERLLGVTRLLSEMVEPLLKAAMQISTLFAQSFFMKFSVTILAVLGRIRVLVQQILVDAVFVYNTFCSLSQKEHALKFDQNGLEVTREYFPSKEATIKLQCVWQTDKFVLVEESHETDTNLQSKHAITLKEPKIQYKSMEIVLGGLNPGCEDHNDSEKEQIESSSVFCASDVDGSSSRTETPAKTITSVNGNLSSRSRSLLYGKKKVAFVAVKPRVSWK